MPQELFNFIHSQVTYFYVFLLTLLVVYCIVKAVQNKFSTAQFYNVVAIVMGTFLMLHAGVAVPYFVAIPVMFLGVGFLAFAFFHASGRFSGQDASKKCHNQHAQP